MLLPPLNDVPVHIQHSMASGLSYYIRLHKLNAQKESLHLHRGLLHKKNLLKVYICCVYLSPKLLLKRISRWNLNTSVYKSTVTSSALSCCVSLHVSVHLCCCRPCKRGTPRFGGFSSQYHGWKWSPGPLFIYWLQQTGRLDCGNHTERRGVRRAATHRAGHIPVLLRSSASIQ